MNPPAPLGSKFLAARQRISRTALAFSIAALLATSASAQLQWDPSNVPGAQGGAGNWLTSNGGNSWLNGTANVGWVNGSSAIFAGTAGNVDSGGVIVDDITFDIAGYTLRLGSSSGSLTLGMGDGIHTITTNASATISIPLAGTSGFTKLGAGTLTLNATSSYSGTTFVNAGTLALSGALLPSSTITVASGTSLSSGPFGVGSTIGGLSGEGSVSIFMNLFVGGNNESTTFSGSISDPPDVPGEVDGILTKQGTGTLTLSGTNFYGGETRIDNGTLAVSGGNAIPDFSFNNIVRIAGAGTLQLLSNETIRNLQGAGTVALGSNTLTIGNGASPSGNYAGTITGSGGFVLKAGAALTLTGTASSFTGGVMIIGSQLSVMNLADIGTNSSIGAGGTITLSNSGLLNFAGPGTANSNRPITLSGSGGRLQVQLAASALTLSGNITGTGSLSLLGAGAFRLSGTNDFTGAVGINTKVEVAGGDALPDNSMVTVSGIGGTLELVTGADETIGALQGGGSVNLGGQRLISGQSNASTTFSGPISGSGASQLEKIGTGTLTLTNANSSFSGGVVVSAGAVSVPHIADAGVNSPLGSNGTITLGFENTLTGELIFTGAGSASTNRPFDFLVGGGIINVAESTATLTLSGALAGEGPLIKHGPGRLHLNGNKNFPGAITAENGTVLINGHLTQSDISVSTSAMLESTAGPWTIGSLSLQDGTLSPGGAGTVGTFNTKDLGLASGILALDLQATGSDRLNVTGTVSLDFLVELKLQLDYDPEDFVDVIPIVVNDGSDATQLGGLGRFFYGGFTLQEGDIFLVSSGAFSQQFEMRYGLDGDNDVRLVAMPEPGVAGLFAVAGLGLLARRRKIPRDKFAAA